MSGFFFAEKTKYSGKETNKEPNVTNAEYANKKDEDNLLI